MPIIIRPQGDSDLANATIHAETGLPQTIPGQTPGSYQVGRVVWAADVVEVPAPGAAVLPASSTAMIFGDSRLSTDRSRVTPSWGSGWPVSRIARGIDNWLETLSRGRVRCPTALNFATPGHSIAEQVAGMEGNITTGLGAGAGFILFLAGVNGIRGGDSGADAVSDAAEAVTLMKASGLPIVMISDWPAFDGTDYTTNSTQWAAHLALRDYVLGLAADPQITVVDAWPIMGGEVASGPQAPLTANLPLFEDAYLHQQSGGAQAIAAALLPVIEGWFPDVPALPADDLSAPTLGTTGGTTSGGVAGTCPTGWIMAGSTLTGLTVTGATGTLALDGSPAHVVTASGTAPAGDPYVRALEQGFTVSEGEVWRILADVEVAAGTTGVNAIMLGALAAFGGSSSVYDLAYWSATDDIFPEVAVSGRYETPAFTIPSGVTSLRLRWRVDFREGEAVSLDARIGNIRFVQDS